MRAKEFLEYKIDNRDGIGAVPNNQDIDYFGLKVEMRPSTFLKLALPMNNTDDDRQAIEYVKQNKDTQGIGAPFLTIDIPDGWEDGNLSKPARITGHDGRHRMMAIMQSEGDEPVETHLFPIGLRRRHFDAHPEWAQQLNQIIIGQRGNAVRGPIFQENAMNEAMFEYICAVEDSTGNARPGGKPVHSKDKAAVYLGKQADEKLSPTDLKRLRAKTNKMKTAESKAERRRGVQLSRQVSWYNNFHK